VPSTTVNPDSFATNYRDSCWLQYHLAEVGESCQDRLPASATTMQDAPMISRPLIDLLAIVASLLIAFLGLLLRQSVATRHRR
jgi:hypothetical protein